MPMFLCSPDLFDAVLDHRQQCLLSSACVFMVVRGCPSVLGQVLKPREGHAGLRLSRVRLP